MKSTETRQGWKHKTTLLRKDEEKKEDVSKEDKRNILDILGLQATVASSQDINKIKELMGPNAHQLKKAYKIINTSTQDVYNRYMTDVEDDKIELFWHGSRNENWLNIISTGLLIRPSGAVYSGSMFGDGIYFADKAQKSIGYSSLRGSHWTRGTANKGFLALFSVHVGKQKHIKRWQREHSSLSYDKVRSEGCDSVFAHGGADLRNNEYIVYKSRQCTISYLIEIG